jgi:uncharacterized protein YdcH (DUF465 family)
MIAELAAANAAYAVIKTCLQNTGELASAGQALVSYFDNKNALQKKANSKGGGSDLQEFMALEQLKQQEQELKDLMIYSGRPGLWQDWIGFQAEAARARREAALEETRKKVRRNEMLYHAFEWVLGIVIALVLAGAITVGVYIYLKSRE